MLLLEYIKAGRDFRASLTQLVYFIIEVISVAIFENPGLQSSAC